MGRGEGEDGVKMGGGVLHAVFLVFIFQIPLGNLPPHHRPEWLNLAIKWTFSKVPL